jgi:uncharacterized protein YprB with RNaseH-like and TPR domain
LKIDEIVGFQKQKTDTKIAFLDIETAPSTGYTWGKWEQNVIDFIQDGYVLSYSFKWAHKPGVKTKGLPDYENWAKSKTDDRAILSDIWKDMDAADIIIGHNGDKFDIPTIKTRFATFGMRPPSPFQTIDTLRIARNNFKFKSNKLDDLGRDLGIGRKMAHTGFHLWLGCMQGDLKSWQVMKRYNKRDVLLLEELYYKFLPWARVHPNVNHNADNCIRCGSDRVRNEGFRFTNLRKKNQRHCLNCGGWFEGSATKP